MFPERIVSGDCASCGFYRRRLVRCTKCKVVAYCDDKERDTHKESHEVECDRICKMIQSYRKRLQGPEGELILNIQCRAQQAISESFTVEVTEYMYAYFCTRYLLGKKMSLERVDAELIRFSHIISAYKWTIKTQRRLIPTALLSYGEDEMCYDFVKWCLRSEIRNDIPQSAIDAGLEYRDRNNRDPFDDNDFFLMDGIDPYDSSTDAILSLAVIFLKVKIIVDLEALEAFADGMTTRPRVPREIITMIKYFAARSCYVERSLHLLEEDHPRKAVDVLTKQVEKLFVEVDGFNPALWPFLIYDTVPDDHSCLPFHALRASTELWECNPQILRFVAKMMNRLTDHKVEGHKIRGT